MSTKNQQKDRTMMMTGAMEHWISANKQMADGFMIGAQNYMKGMEEVGMSCVSCMMAFSQQYMANCRSMVAVKTAKDAMENHMGFVRGQMETAMSEGMRAAMMCATIASEMVEPMQSQWMTPANTRRAEAA